MNLRSAVRRIFVKINCKPIKSQSEPQRWETVGSSRNTTRIGERIWTDVEPDEYSISDYEVSQKLFHLLRHGSLPRKNDGVIEFWRTKNYLQDHFVFCHHWSDEKWKSSMAGGEGNKKIFQYCTDSSAGAILFHSRHNFMYPTLQDNVFIPNNFFPSFLMFDVQSIYILSSIWDWYLKVKIRAVYRQYSFCLWILGTEVTRFLMRLIWMYHVVHNTCTMHGRDIKTRYIGSTSIWRLKKDWHSSRLDRMLYGRTVKPIVVRDASHAQGARKTSRSQEIETRSFHDPLNMIERTNPLFAVT